jgi:cytochrome c oxidase subunit 4
MRGSGVNETADSKTMRATYLRTWVLLMLLLVVTAAGGRVPLGAGNLILALGVALAKAALVLLYFMHLRFSRSSIWLAAGAALFWLGVLFVLSLNDFLSRGAIGVLGK